MPLWKRLWLLFTVMWGVVAVLNIATILAFADGGEREKVWRPILLAVAVPALAYAVAWIWFRLSGGKPSEGPPPGK